jgi:hypothetical protein
VATVLRIEEVNLTVPEVHAAVFQLYGETTIAGSEGSWQHPERPKKVNQLPAAQEFLDHICP